MDVLDDALDLVPLAIEFVFPEPSTGSGGLDVGDPASGIGRREDPAFVVVDVSGEVHIDSRRLQEWNDMHAKLGVEGLLVDLRVGRVMVEYQQPVGFLGGIGEEVIVEPLVLLAARHEGEVRIEDDEVAAGVVKGEPVLIAGLGQVVVEPVRVPLVVADRRVEGDVLRQRLQGREKLHSPRCVDITVVDNITDSHGDVRIVGRHQPRYLAKDRRICLVVSPDGEAHRGLIFRRCCKGLGRALDELASGL